MVSVIVPVYNVEEQLQRCIDSLKCITTDSVEILLIDDGSTDNSGKICDEVNDSRFRVFHTDNHGLSAARNYGIEQAYGEWLMFVDSDDWVEADFCSVPLNVAIRYGADLVAFQKKYWGHKNTRHKLRLFKKSNNRENLYGVVSKETAFMFGGVAAWDKLYKRELFDDIRYPEGRICEDIATTHKLIYKAKRIVIIPNILYNKDFRNESLSNTRSLKHNKDNFLSWRERYVFLQSHNYPIIREQTCLWKSAIMFLAKQSLDDEDDEATVKLAEDIIKEAPWISKNLSLITWIMIFIYKLDKRVFYNICSRVTKLIINR